jgi:D-alanine-D-alanine ligase
MTTRINPESLGKVVVLFGGRSAEREISLKSGSMVLAALKRNGVDAHGFDPAERGMLELAQGNFDRAVISLHGRFGEDGTIQGVLEWLNIPYTGSGVSSSALCMDKILTKVCWISQGLATPDYVQLKLGFNQDEVIRRLGLPLIVKPAQEGSTLGLTKVKTADQLNAAFEFAYQYDVNVLAEKFISGQELTVPLMGEGDRAYALPVIRIQAPEGNYDYHNKYFGNETKYYCPSGLDGSFEAEVQSLCVKAYQALGCSGWGRADVLVDENAKPWLLEINTSPGMTDHSLVPMSARVSGLEYDDLVMQIASSASLKLSAFNARSIN